MLYFRYSEQKSLSGAGCAAFVGLAFHQYDIRTDFSDTVPGNYVIFPAAYHSEKAAGSRNHDGTYTSARNVNLDIRNKSQPLAGADTEDLFALQVSELDRHGAFLLLDLGYAGLERIRTVQGCLSENL